MTVIIATDILVVGLGPAGSRAAHAAASQGCRVIGIDRRSVIGEPIQCAEFIPNPIGALAQAPGVLQQRISGMRTVLPSGTEQASDFPGLVIDRAAFDQALVAMAAEAGAEIWTQARLIQLDAQHQIAWVQLSGGNDNASGNIRAKRGNVNCGIGNRRGNNSDGAGGSGSGSSNNGHNHNHNHASGSGSGSGSGHGNENGNIIGIQYQALIAADGPHSTIAARLGLPPLTTVTTRQYTVPLLKPLADTYIWLGAAYPGGYAWLFPRGALANLGLGLDPKRGIGMKPALDQLHQRLIASGWVGKEILRRTGGAIPVGGLRANLTHETIVFAGDAAGFTHPITGAGIAAAVVSGSAAGTAAADFVAGDHAALATYDEDMRDQFTPTLERAVAQRRGLDAVWHTPVAAEDTPHRHGWIAFPEYFAGTGVHA